MAILGIETDSAAERNSFGWWLSGFTDAEGTFSITRYQGKARKDGLRCPSGYTFEFSIALRDDELDILEQIKSYFGAGRILSGSREKARLTGMSGSKDQFSFKIRDWDSIINVLIPHFDKFPLLSKKYRDYAVFREAVMLHKSYLENGGSFHKWGNTDHANALEALRIKLNEGRDSFFKDGILPKSPYLDLVSPDQFKAWLPGFVDGDGCFGGYLGKGENPSIGFKFIVHLREDDRFLLEAMKEHIGCGYLRYKPCCKSSTTNAKPQLSYEITSAEDCHIHLLQIFREHALRAKKCRDFLLFDEAVSLLVKAQGLRKNKYTECKTQEEKESRQYIKGLVTQLRLIKEYK